MSKRRNKKPNLPDDVLARARKQAGIEEPETDDTNDDVDDTEENGNGQAETVNVASRASRRRKLSPAQLERQRKRGTLDPDTVREMLANPTVFVTEEQLHQDYKHVLVDLRNMGLLAAILMVALVSMAQFL